MGCGLGWFVGPKFLLSDGLGWVDQSFGGLGWVGLKKVDPWTTLGPYCDILLCAVRRFSARETKRHYPVNRYYAKHKVNTTSRKNGEVKDVPQSTYTSRMSLNKIQSQVMRQPTQHHNQQQTTVSAMHDERCCVLEDVYARQHQPSEKYHINC